VAIGTAVSHLLLAGLALPWLITRRLGLPLHRYWLGIYGRTALAIVPFAAAVLAVRAFVPLTGLLQFFAIVGALSIMYVALVWFVALTLEERDQLGEQLPFLRRRAA
jgi:hypothetical protein